MTGHILSHRPPPPTYRPSSPPPRLPACSGPARNGRRIFPVSVSGDFHCSSSLSSSVWTKKTITQTSSFSVSCCTDTTVSLGWRTSGTFSVRKRIPKEPEKDLFTCYCPTGTWPPLDPPAPTAPVPLPEITKLTLSLIELWFTTTSLVMGLCNKLCILLFINAWNRCNSSTV